MGGPAIAHRYSGDDINEMLRQRVERLCEALRLEFRRDGHNLWVKDYRRGGNFTSFSIRTDRGMWKDFSQHSEAKKQGGDLISLIAEFEYGGHSKEENRKAFLWARDWLGLEIGSDLAPDPKQIAALAENRRKQDEEDRAREQRHRDTAKAIYLGAQPLSGKDPASLYLMQRGIDVLKLKDGPPHSLRFDPRCWANPEGVAMPAMVACIAGRGGMLAVHRTYLEFANGIWRKAWKGARVNDKPVAAKRVLGRYAGGTIRLTKGASRKPLANAPDGEWIVVSEGIENALTVALVAPHMRCLAAVSISNLGNIELPPQIGGVLIVADNDTKTAAVDGLERAMDRLAERGFEPAVIKTEDGFKDINDMLKGVSRV